MHLLIDTLKETGKEGRTSIGWLIYYVLVFFSWYFNNQLSNIQTTNAVYIFYIHFVRIEVMVSYLQHFFMHSESRSNAAVSWWFCWTMMAVSLLCCSPPVHMSLSCRFLTCDFSFWFILHVCSHHRFLGTGNNQLNQKVYRMNQTGGKNIWTPVMSFPPLPHMNSRHLFNGPYEYFNNVWILDLW